MNHVLSKMVAHDICCTIIPQSHAGNYDRAAWFYLTSDPVWEVAMVYNKNNPPSKAGWYFIKLAQEHGQEMEKRLREAQVQMFYSEGKTRGVDFISDGERVWVREY